MEMNIKKKLAVTLSGGMLLAMGFVSQASAAVVAFTDRGAWETALSGASIFEETFDGAQSDFGPNSFGNIIGGLSVDIIGHVGDGSPQGLTGTGFFEGEVDSTGSDAAQINFNLSTFGFALIGLQDDSVTSPDVNVHEFGIQAGGQSFLLSDVLGLTTLADSSAPDSQVPFIGFVSDTSLAGFTLVHGDLVRPVSGSNESFWLDGLAYAVSPVPEPSTYALMLGGLGLVGFMAARRRAKQGS